MKKSIALFLTLLTLQATSTITGKQVADRLADIERQSHRKFKIFLKSQTFTQDEINSFLSYKIKDTNSSSSFEVKEARVIINKRDFKLYMVVMSNKILPLFDLEAASMKILPLSLTFGVEQRKGKYRIKITDFRIGKSVASIKLALTILRDLKKSTGFNFVPDTWEKFPFGIKKFKQSKGKVEVFY